MPTIRPTSRTAPEKKLAVAVFIASGLLFLSGCSADMSDDADISAMSSTSGCSPTSATELKCGYSGSPYTWTVPQGVTSITFEAAGGRGGDAVNDLASGTGAWGADISGTVDVAPGDQLVIAVGGNGDGDQGWGYSGMSGGPANTASNTWRNGGAGGGGTIIQNQTTGELIAVAGGGGGAGGTSSDYDSNGAGGAGGITGESGSIRPSLTGQNGGEGTSGPLGGQGGKAGAASNASGDRGEGGSGEGGNGGSGGGGVIGGGPGTGASGGSAAGGGGAGTSMYAPGSPPQS